MAYYSALITAWNLSSASSGALPSGVTGTSLFGLTTAQKIAAINAWTITGSVPTTLYVTGNQVANCIVWSEFAALTAAQQQNILLMLSIEGLLLGGSSNLTELPNGMMLAAFGAGTQTRANLIALAQGTVQPWWQVPVASGGGGLNGVVSQTDVTYAGLS